MTDEGAPGVEPNPDGPGGPPAVVLTRSDGTGSKTTPDSAPRGL